MNRKLSNKEFGKIFDTIAPKFDKVVNQYAIKRRIQFFSKFAKGKCLEVGAGTGIISKELGNSHKITTIDISPEMVKVLKSKGLNATVADAEKLPFPSNSFDTVIASEVIYYLDHPEKFIKEVRRVLRKDGKILISSATELSKYYDKTRAILRKLGFNSMYFNDKNDKFMSKEELHSLLESTGFKEIYDEDALILPFARLHFVNILLERTYLSKFAAFTFIAAQK